MKLFDFIESDESWMKERAERRNHEWFVLMLVMMGPLVAILLATLIAVVAERFGVAPSLFSLLPSAVMSYYVIRKLVYLETEETNDEKE